jgi:hypothetical protein
MAVLASLGGALKGIVYSEVNIISEKKHEWYGHHATIIGKLRRHTTLPLILIRERPANRELPYIWDEVSAVQFNGVPVSSDYLEPGIEYGFQSPCLMERVAPSEKVYVVERDQWPSVAPVSMSIVNVGS